MCNSLERITLQSEGKIAKGSREAVVQHFNANGGVLRDRNWISAELQKLLGEGYEDDVVTMTAKLLAGVP